MLLSYVVLLVVGIILQYREALVRECRVLLDRAEFHKFTTLVAACAGLLLSVAARAMIDGYVYSTQPVAPEALRHDYVMLIDGNSHSWVASDLALLLSVVQSLLVGLVVLVVRAYRHKRRSTTLVIVTFTAMIAIALADHTLKSSDVYAYVGFIKLGLAAYHPLNRELTGDYHFIHVMWGFPLLPCPYGPLWLGITTLVTSFATDVSSTIFSLRAFNAVLMALGSVLIARASGRIDVAAAFALNPALIEEFVIDGHNDILGVVTLLLAICVVRTPVLRAACIVAAGCIKLPFLIVGIISVVPGATPLQRVLACVAIVLSALGISIAWAGPTYLGAIAYQSDMHSATNQLLNNTHVACNVVLGLSFLRVIWLGRVAAGTAAVAMSMGVLPFPWYLAWGIPIADRAGALAPFLIALPFCVGLLSGFTYAWTAFRDFAALAFSLLAVIVTIRACLRGRSKATIPTPQ